MGHVLDNAISGSLHDINFRTLEEFTHRLEIQKHTSLQECDKAEVELKVHVSIDLHDEWDDELRLVLAPYELMVFLADTAVPINKIEYQILMSVHEHAGHESIEFLTHQFIRAIPKSTLGLVIHGQNSSKITRLPRYNDHTILLGVLDVVILGFQVVFFHGFLLHDLDYFKFGIFNLDFEVENEAHEEFVEVSHL